MLIEQTLDSLNGMKLGAMADAVQKQLGTDEAAALSFEERLGLLVKQYEKEISSMEEGGQLSEARLDWGLLYGEFSVGQSDF